MAQDFYATLGVARDADDAAIKSAFRKGAMQFHPDRNKDDPSAEHKFKELSAAYECLSDPQSRAAYVRFGHAAFQNVGMYVALGAHVLNASAFADVFDDIF
ncbi:MAG: DnaJ domain-containing protein, partial [Amphiplicatus sp.]